uniref:CHCH domain-containing protein n=1 Tax=Quercus lobata TaxID=97700 RepID=A0A7N2R4G7_QUELO
MSAGDFGHCISYLYELFGFIMVGGAFGGNRGLRPVPPEKGIFPLDHMHLCDLEKKEYLSCLKSSGHTSEKCRHLSKKYLQCRMEKLLKAKISPPKPQLLLLSLALAALGNNNDPFPQFVCTEKVRIHPFTAVKEKKATWWSSVTPIISPWEAAVTPFPQKPC